MSIVDKKDEGHILAIYLDGEAGHLINGTPIRIVEVNDEYLEGYTQVCVLANGGSAKETELMKMDKAGTDYRGQSINEWYKMLRDATVDKEKVKIPQKRILFVKEPKVTDASRLGMPYLGENVFADKLNTGYPKPAWQATEMDESI